MTADLPSSAEAPRATRTGSGLALRARTPLGANIARILWDAADRAPDHPAIVEREVTYADLCARAAGIAGALLDAGVKPGDRVAIFLDGSATAGAAFFGAAACGAAAVNVNETLRPRQVEHILTHCAAAALVTSADMLGRQPPSPDHHARPRRRRDRRR